MSSYKKEFLAAIARTKKYRFASEQPELACSLNLLTPDKMLSLNQLVKRALYESEHQKLAFNCLNITQALVVPVAELLGCDVFYTLGWLDNKGVHTYEFNEATIEEVLLNGHTQTTASCLHAWLTLPSLELIDATLATSIGIIQRDPKLIGEIIAGPADIMQEPAYKPMLLGTKYLHVLPKPAWKRVFYACCRWVSSIFGQLRAHPVY